MTKPAKVYQERVMFRPMTNHVKVYQERVLFRPMIKHVKVYQGKVLLEPTKTVQDGKVAKTPGVGVEVT